MCCDVGDVGWGGSAAPAPQPLERDIGKMVNNRQVDVAEFKNAAVNA